MWRRKRIGTSITAVAAMIGAVVAMATPASTAAPAEPAEPVMVTSELPALSISGNYVAGISSGGYMATQLQVAYSSRFAGAGVVSAGPYYCAQNSLTIALTACTDNTVPTDVAALEAQTRDYAAAGLIDPVANLRQQRTWAFHGTQDVTVKRSVADGLATYYRDFGVPLVYRQDVAAGHAWISPLGPVACSSTAPPYINDCGIDAPGAMLKTMFGAVNRPNPGSPRGRLVQFSQNSYATPAEPGAGDLTKTGAPAIGMGSTGFAYIPSACTSRSACKLVVAFVVLYPQATPDPNLGNPKGCWDWWGYLGAQDDRYATKAGPQMSTVMRMVSRLGG